MIRYLVFALLVILPASAHADFWGGDLPLLAEIVTNTLQSLSQLEQQTSLMGDEMAGIKDRIDRIQTISDLVQPSTWNQWRDPVAAMQRLQVIYYTIPKEYRSEKSDQIQEELSEAMNTISRMSPGALSSFHSGRELERRGADASPGVAQKLTASGVGSLVAIEAQNQVLQSHMTSLLVQLLADANERESRQMVSQGKGFTGISEGLGSADARFSTHVFPMRIN